MAHTKLPEHPFNLSTPYSFRAVTQDWVKEQVDTRQVSTIEALEEAINTIFERAGNNLLEDGNTLVYFPGNEADPYIVGIPIDNRRAFEKYPPYPGQGSHQGPEDKDHVIGIRKDFEALMKLRYPKLQDSNLAVDENGNYLDNDLQNHWKGFNLYHHGLTIASTTSDGDREKRTLGRYVVSKVGRNGAFIFKGSPIRHTTREEANTKAVELSKEHKEPFAILRCLDVIDVRERG